VSEYSAGFDTSSIWGVPIYLDNSLGWSHVQVRFPRSKSKRIRKKWQHDLRNFARIQKPACFKLPAGLGLGRESFIANDLFLRKLSKASKGAA
jgi:hypothetical protein